MWIGPNGSGELEPVHAGHVDVGQHEIHSVAGQRGERLGTVFRDDFVLADIRPKYQEAGVPCTDATGIFAATAPSTIACAGPGEFGTIRMPLTF